MNCINVNESYSNQFNSSIKKVLEKIKEKGGVVIDIRYQKTKGDFDALIIYCDKSEYREIVIDKLFDKFEK